MAAELATSPPVGRLAPSPTGAQHVGNARTYLLAWLSIRSRSGRLILRMEDIDSPRIKQGADQQAIDDLAWLGLDWDEEPYVQSQRLALYDDALERLKQAQRVYPCTCTRSDIAAAASAPHAGQEGPKYPGTCASRSAGDADDLAKAGAAFAWRFRATDQVREFRDLVAGEQRCNVARDLGDFVVGKTDGTPAYQLAVVVDDAAMGITEVLRGDDLLASSFRQLELYEALGLKPPAFAHVPLVVGPDGRRLAKRHGDSRLSTLREQGVAPERLVGLLAWSCGLLDQPRSCRPEEILPSFTLACLPRQPWVYQEEASM
ncbi:MAG: tRNA glutamyl-Q(34) synthetase GluQRS [Planctomycetaceae bacterium]|nr:tRNA glutamyl-Q(34) synthetase GluQRS [Planctomycetaceae bacterium]